MKHIVAAVVVALLLVTPALALIDLTDASSINYKSPHGDLYVVQLRYDPFPASPGTYVDVWYKVENRGDGDLQDVQFILMPAFPFSIDANDVTTKSLGTISAHQAALVKFKVRVSESALQGDQPLEYTWSADGATNVPVSSSDISVRSANSLLAVTDVTAAPESIIPGGKSTIEIQVANIGDSFLRYVTVGMQLVTEIPSATGTTVTELPFTPDGKGVTQSVVNLAPGNNATLDFPIMANPDAKSQPYKIPLSISYIDSNGDKVTTNEMVGISVTAEPDLLVYVDKNDIVDATTPAEVVLRFVNKGRSDVKFLTATLQEADKYTVINSPTQYVGQVNSDDYETASWTLKLKTMQSSVDLPLIVSYEDANGKKYSTGMTVTIPIHTQQDLGQTSNNYSAIIIVVIVLLIVGYFIYRSRRGKKKRAE